MRVRDLVENPALGLRLEAAVTTLLYLAIGTRPEKNVRLPLGGVDEEGLKRESLA